MTLRPTNGVSKVPMYIPKGSHAKLKRFYDDGFSISELAVMYHTIERYIEAVLEDEVL